MTRSLAFVGCNIGIDVDRQVLAHDVCWLFEPITEVAQALLERYSVPEFSGKSIKIVNAACFTDSQPREFHVYNQNGLSSSLGTVTEEAKALFANTDLSLSDTRTVACTLLSDYLPIWLDTLIIDAQGSDLAILKTVENWLAGGRIESIRIECDGDGFRHYDGLGDNSQESLLSYMRRFPYTGSRVPGLLTEHPDWVFKKKVDN